MDAGFGYMKFAIVVLVVLLHVVIGLAIASHFTPISDLIWCIIVGAVFIVAYPIVIIGIYWGIKDRIFFD